MSQLRRILVVEDEYLVAQDLAEDLRALGAEVVGPVPSVQMALAAVDAAPRLDGAILDINLQGKMSFPVADRLAAREVPFFFTTGYDQGTIPDRYADVPRCEKPVTAPRLKRALAQSFDL
jgi:CheY-like chemotaxis protein